MYEVVRRFYDSDTPLSELITEIGNLEDPFEKTLLDILRHLDENIYPDEKTHKQIDEAVKNGHPDQDLFVLFISYLLTVYSRDLMATNSHDFILEKGNSVYRISCSLDLKNYRVESQAYYYQSSGYFFYTKNNFAKGDELNLLALQKMPKKSPRYRDFLSRTAQIFGNLGRLSLIPPFDDELLDSSLDKNFFIIRSLFMNSIFICNAELASKYLELLSKNYKNAMAWLNREGKSQSALAIVKGNLEEPPFDYPEMNICLAYYRSLKNKDFEEAKKLFGNIRESYLYFNCYYLFYFAEYHHSFVTGWFENIEHTLQNKEENSYHYMLDFFIARYFLYKKNKELARFYYAQLLKSCVKHNAIARLKYEMQFAVELSLSSFFDFTFPRQIFNFDKLRKSLEIAITPTAIDLFGINRIIGNSKAINEVKKKAKLYADIQRPILIIGETGAGKEIVASAIHEESSHKNKPFLAINCGALTDTLLQSELFGYEAGAFTGAVNSHKGIFEAAEDGVVFLDEFGDMSPKLQVSMLRILENNELLKVGGTKVKKIKCRIIAATNANIEELIHQKKFREDLYHRLKQFTITILPLRERKEDIPELINYFLNLQNRGQVQVFSKELMSKFQEYHWPGNIRELKNEIDRIKILCGYKPIIEIDDIDIEWIIKKNASTEKSKPEAIVTASNRYEQMHQRLLETKLSSSDKRSKQIMLLFKQHKKLNRVQIAEMLEVSLLTITNDLKRLVAEGLIEKHMPTLSRRSHYFEIKES